MDVAIIGCGFVSYLYGGTFHNHPSIRVVGAFDRDAARTRLWCAKFGGRVWRSLEETLASDAQLVLNLTNPCSHYEITRQCLHAGKHVYTEKPLATSLAEARSLSELAGSRNLFLGCAPCSLLGESAQTLWRALNQKLIGRIHSAQVMLSMPPTAPQLAAAWARSHQRGGLAASAAEGLSFPVTWPYEDEFRVGPAYEHAAYALKWLTTWFGPVKKLVNYSAARLPHKPAWNHLQGCCDTVRTATADLYVSCLTLEDDVEALFINSTVMSLDLRFTLHGEGGSLEVENQWDFAAPVRTRHSGLLMPEMRHTYPHSMPERFTRRYPRGYRVNMDYARGVAELIRAIEARVPSDSTCSTAQEVHVQEITDLIAGTSGGLSFPKTTFTTRPRPKPLPKRVGIAVICRATDFESVIAALSAGAHCTLVGALDCSTRGISAPPESCRLYRHLAELLSDENVAVVLNLADEPQRLKLTLACLRARKHVSFEAPAAPVLAEALSIQEIAERCGLRVASEAGWCRAVLERAELVRAGARGEIRRVDGAAHSESIGRLLWLATWILGPIWRIRARRGPHLHEAESLTITLASGTCMTLQMTGATSQTGTDHMDFVGEYATERLLLEGPGPGAFTERAYGVIDLCDSICAGRSHRFTLDHAVHQAEILEALRASLATDREVTVRSPAVLGSWQ